MSLVPPQFPCFSVPGSGRVATRHGEETMRVVGSSPGPPRIIVAAGEPIESYSSGRVRQKQVRGNVGNPDPNPRGPPARELCVGVGLRDDRADDRVRCCPGSRGLSRSGSG